MSPHQICRRAISTSICVLLYFASYVLSENIISLKQIQPDNACGPKCLYAIMQITKEGRPDCGIKCIYKLIGKKPFTAVNMKELRDVAAELGFGARGYKFTVKDLAKIKDYAILPVGNSPGTFVKPLHFILVESANENYATIVNTETLERQAIAISDLQQQWEGYTLVISTSSKKCAAKKEDGNIVSCIAGQYDETKDFGVVDSGSILRHTFKIAGKADGVSDIKIVSKSCTCLKAEIGKDTEGDNTLTMELSVNRPAWQDAYAVIMLKPGDIIKRYAVKAYGKDSFQITPQKGYFEAPQGGKVEYPVKIEYFTGSDDVVQFDHIESNIAGLKTGLVKTNTAAKDKVSTFSFDIPLIYNAGDETGIVDGKVKFVLNTVKEQRFIPFEFTAKIGTEKFRLTPQKLFIVASQTDFNSVSNNKAKIEFLTKSIPEKIVIQKPEDLPCDIRIVPTSNVSYIVELMLDKERLKRLNTGLHKSQVNIIPEYKDAASSDVNNIALPVSLFIR